MLFRSMRWERSGVGMIRTQNLRWSGNGDGIPDWEVVVMTWGMEGLPLLSQAQAAVLAKVLLVGSKRNQFEVAYWKYIQRSHRGQLREGFSNKNSWASFPLGQRFSNFSQHQNHHLVHLLGPMPSKNLHFSPGPR